MMVSLGFKSGYAGLEVQMNPLPFSKIYFEFNLLFTLFTKPCHRMIFKIYTAGLEM